MSCFLFWLIEGVKSMTKGISASKRAKIFSRDDFKCQICGVSVNEENAHLDHIVQRARFGSNSYENLATTCRSCNLKRGNRLSYDYLKIGLKRHESFLKLLINYEKRFGIFDEEEFVKNLCEYENELKKEVNRFNNILNFLEEKTHV
jgi:hypothetical protein